MIYQKFIDSEGFLKAKKLFSRWSELWSPGPIGLYQECEWVPFRVIPKAMCHVSRPVSLSQKSKLVEKTLSYLPLAPKTEPRLKSIGN